MRSSVTLRIEITHSVNLRTDAQGFANEVQAMLTTQIARYDSLGSAFAKVTGSAIEVWRGRQVSASANNEDRP